MKKLAEHSKGPEIRDEAKMEKNTFFLMLSKRIRTN